ncbi:hypothetical protein BH11BAC4_BH11BAC4_04830 [soil metagenome]
MNKKLLPRIYFFIGAVSILLMGSSFSTHSYPTVKTGMLKISFINTVNGKPIILRDSIYSNYFGEQYSISKLKYYISHIVLTGDGKPAKMDEYYLINAASEENSIEFSLPEGKYKSMQFLLGVDSIHNCSGAQTGALDPMNDMFWTWNSGYVMFKLEGSSPASSSDLNRIEHHVGGYKGTNNVATAIKMDIGTSNSLEIKAGATTELIIETNLDHYWHGTNDIRISDLSVCMIPGELAKKIAANFTGLFSIKSIHTNP